jgi:hypothetical protein
METSPSVNSNAYTQYRLGSDGSIYEYNYKGRYYKLSQKEVLDLYYLMILMTRL